MRQFKWQNFFLIQMLYYDNQFLLCFKFSQETKTNQHHHQTIKLATRQKIKSSDIYWTQSRQCQLTCCNNMKVFKLLEWIITLKSPLVSIRNLMIDKKGISEYFSSSLAESVGYSTHRGTVIFQVYVFSIHFMKMSRKETCANRSKQIPWSESASELYRPSGHRLCSKLEPNFADRGCYVVSVMDPYGCILCFLDRSRYFSFEVAHVWQLDHRGGRTIRSSNK
jgi:hypothetical protein